MFFIKFIINFLLKNLNLKQNGIDFKDFITRFAFIS